MANVLRAPLLGPLAPIVAVRCRPLAATGESSVTDIVGGRVLIGVLPFTFDHVFDGDASQEQVYRTLGEPLVDRCFDGLNGTLLAYGQTGSGKSHSMTGSANDPGIIPRLVRGLFDRAVAAEASGGSSVYVSCSVLEIYNENLIDLLAEKTNASKLELREDPVHGVQVNGLQSFPVRTAEEVHALLDTSNALRAVAATNMNLASSRSHMVVSLRVVQSLAAVDGATRKEVRSTINLVDLAGSERANKTGATGEALKQGSHINKSLSTLGNVVSALADASRAAARKKPRSAASAKSPALADANPEPRAESTRPDTKSEAGQPAGVHVPYRDSKLTRVLQESLGGNSVTVMLANVSQQASDREETLATLHFAERAKAITLKAKRNEITTATAAAAAEAAAAKAAAALAVKARARAKREAQPRTLVADEMRRERRLGKSAERRAHTCAAANKSRAGMRAHDGARKVSSANGSRFCYCEEANCARCSELLLLDMQMVRRDFWASAAGMESDAAGWEDGVNEGGHEISEHEIPKAVAVEEAEVVGAVVNAMVAAVAAEECIIDIDGRAAADEAEDDEVLAAFLAGEDMSNLEAIKEMSTSQEARALHDFNRLDAFVAAGA